MFPNLHQPLLDNYLGREGYFAHRVIEAPNFEFAGLQMKSIFL